MKKESFKDENIASDYDSGWKEIIGLYFPDFVNFYYPELDVKIDYTRGYEFLDNELQAIIGGSEIGNREADKLVKIYLKTGEEKWILMHIEVQTQKVVDLPKRMFIYYYKIFEKYGRDIISILILGDGNKNYRPEKYERKYEGCRLLFEYKFVKLIDYIDAELEKSNNVFAMITLSHLKAVEAGADIEKKKIFKLELVRKLRNKGYSQNDIRNLHKFVDWLIRLPIEAEKEIHEKVKKYEEVIQMPMMFAIEKIFKEEAREEGREEEREKIRQEKIAMVKTMYRYKEPLDKIKLYTGFEKEEIKKILEEV